jgi:hypothetical protein
MDDPGDPVYIPRYAYAEPLAALWHNAEIFLSIRYYCGFKDSTEIKDGL